MDAGDTETQNILRQLDSFGQPQLGYGLANDRPTKCISSEFERKLNSVNLEKRSHFREEDLTSKAFEMASSASGSKNEISKEDIMHWKHQVLQASRPTNQWYDRQCTSTSPDLVHSSTAMSDSSESRSRTCPLNTVATVSGDDTVFSASNARKSQRSSKTSAPTLPKETKNGNPVKNEGIYYARLCRVEELPDDQEKSPLGRHTNDEPTAPKEAAKIGATSSSAADGGCLQEMPKNPSKGSTSSVVRPQVVVAKQSSEARLANTELSLERTLEEQRRKYKEITDRIEEELKSAQTPIGACSICGQQIAERTEAVCALGYVFHNACLVCELCGRTLRGKRFYKVHEKFFCEEDYLYAGMHKTAERCAACSHPIINEVLQAFGKSYHPRCFRCEKCRICLDGIPFALDSQEKVYCMSDYQHLFSPLCAACKHQIIPNAGCCCQLTDEPGKRCHPLGEHLLCQKCHIHWKRTGGTEHLITDL